jgi:tetratricopeptide (TPR) repeat protein
MSDAIAADGQDSAPASSPLGRMLGLNEEEVGALGAIFAEAARAMGIDGGPIFERLKAGQSLGRALGMPKGTGDLLYARAHRWFSVGRIDKAEPLFRALCILDEGSANHWVGYGVCLRLRGSLNEADLAFQTAAKLRADWAVPHFHALELAVHRGDWERAAQHLALYDERVTADTADAIKAEAARLRTAIEVHRGADRS